jgi:hypothetical protein
LLFEIGSGYVVQACLELATFLLRPTKYWVYRHVPPCPFSSPFHPLFFPPLTGKSVA